MKNNLLIAGGLIAVLLFGTGIAFAQPFEGREGDCRIGALSELTDDQIETLKEIMKIDREDHLQTMQDLRESGATREEIGEYVDQRQESMKQNLEDLGIDVEIPMKSKNFGTGRRMGFRHRSILE